LDYLSAVSSGGLLCWLCFVTSDISKMYVHSYVLGLCVMKITYQRCYMKYFTISAVWYTQSFWPKQVVWSYDASLCYDF